MVIDGGPMNVCVYSSESTSDRQVCVESSFVRGFSGVRLIGNVADGCRGGIERARTALEISGFEIPTRSIVVNMSPAEIRQSSSHLDLPMAVSIAALGMDSELGVNLDEWLFAAELSISGELRAIRSAVSFVLSAHALGKRGLIIAAENRNEVLATVRLLPALQSLKVLAFVNLSQVISWLAGGCGPESESPQLDSDPAVANEAKDLPNFDDMMLSEGLKTVALTVATGSHSLLLRGTPGTGKSMFASRLASIFPVMDPYQHIEALQIHNLVVDRLGRELLEGRPPFRAPHHQASAASILGTPEQPGELSLAHGGLLFLDEFPEFRRDVLEALREPLEVGQVQLSRAQKKVTRHAQAILLAACNDCPCGWSGSSVRRCRCHLRSILNYRNRISGPILDRIDMQVFMGDSNPDRVAFIFEVAASKASQTKELRERVKGARDFGAKRNSLLAITSNSALRAEHLQQVSGLRSSDFASLLSECPPNASRRSVLRAVRLARTLADLDASECIRAHDLEQAWDWLPADEG